MHWISILFAFAAAVVAIGSSCYIYSDASELKGSVRIFGYIVATIELLIGLVMAMAAGLLWSIK